MPSRRRAPRRQVAAASDQATAPDRAPARENPASSGQEETEAPGWLDRAGSWIADKYDAASAAVTETIDSATTTARDLWDVAKSTDVDVDWKERKLSVSTDMDEVLDLMPESAQSALQLDRGAEGANEVKMELDHKNHTVTITSADVRLAGLNTGELALNGASLSDVRIVIRGDGGLPVVGDAASTSVQVSVGSVQADGVIAQTSEGPVKASRVSLGRMSVTASSDGDAMLSGGAASSANFFVDSAVLEGVSGNGQSADRVALDGVNAGLDQADGTAHVSAGSVSASGMEAHGAQADDVSAQGVRMDMRKAEDGSVSRQVAARRASAQGIRTADGGTVGSVSADDLALSKQDGLLGIAARQVALGDVDHQAGSLDAATLQDLDLDVSQPHGEGWQATMGLGAADVTGLGVDGVSVAHGSLSGVRGTASGTEGGAKVGLDVGSATARGVTDGRGFSLERGHLQGARIDSAPGSFVGTSEQSAVTGLDTGDVSIASGSAAGFGFSSRAGVERYSADRAQASGIGAGGATVDSATVAGMSVDKGHGTVRARSTDLQAAGIRAGTASVDEASVSGLDMSAGRAGQQVAADQVSASGIAAGGATVERAALTGGSVKRSGDQLSASVGDAELTGVGGQHGTASRLAMSRASITHGGDATSVRVGHLEGAGLQRDRRGAGSVSFDGIAADRKGSTIDASIASGRGTDIVTGDLAAARASVTGWTGHHADGRTELTAEQMTAGDLSVGQTHIGGVSVRDGGLVREGESVTGTAAQLDAARLRHGDSLTVGTAHGTSISASGGRGPGTTFAADRFSATDLGYRDGATQASVGHIGVQGGSTHLGGGRPTGSASQIELRDLQGQSALGASPKALGPEGPVDMAGLRASGSVSLGAGDVDLGSGAGAMRSLGRRVDDADIRASAPLRAHDYGMAEIERGTEAQGRLAVQDGRITSDTRVDLSKPVDGPLWVGGHGAYVDDKGKLRADLSGMWDMDIGKRIAPEMGMSRFPTRVSEATDALAGPTRASGESVTIGQAERAGDNTVQVQAGHQELVASFSRFLTSALKLDVGGTAVEAGQGSIEDAKVELDGSSGTQQVTGSVGRITVRDVKAQ